MPFIRPLFFLLLSLLLAGPLLAQDNSSTRDPIDLARRLLDFDAEYAIPPLRPRYELGDTAEFWVSQGRNESPTKITAALVADTRSVYVWVEQGLFYSREDMFQIADLYNQLFYVMRMRSNYEGVITVPEYGSVFNSTINPLNLYAVSDVDNDSHLSILYARNMGQEIVSYNFNNELPQAVAPGGYSNQHEVLLVNASALPTVPIHDTAFTVPVAEAIFNFIAESRQPAQDRWLFEASASLFAREFELPELRPNATNAFLNNPNVSLIHPVSRTANPMATYGAQQLFITYLSQRFGSGVIIDMIGQPGRGLEPLGAALAKNDFIDPVNGAEVTGDSVFADFVIANILSNVLPQPFGDGRYNYAPQTLPDVTPQTSVLRNDFDNTLEAQTVAQYGTRYLVLIADQAAVVQVDFEGHDTARLPLPEDTAPENHVYWSGRGSNQDTHLTRHLDLSTVDSATLQFDVWYDLNYRRNYAYVEVSTDGGQSWDILPAPISTTNNHFGLAYGPGFTGKSNEIAPSAAPFIGIVFSTEDGVSILEIMPDGPASRSELQVGDRIIGHDGAVWQQGPDIIGMLAERQAGDTLNLLVERDGERLDIETTLGEHPTNTRYPEAEWVAQAVDLSAYAGQEILLRFEYISQPNTNDYGIALDNIRVPELEFSDDAESEGDWTLQGWQRVNNRMAQPYLVQYVNIGPGESPVTRVRHLIGPDDSAQSGEWTLPLSAGEVVVLAISGLSHETDLPASYDLRFSEIR